jgi:histidyl-tRNA synthetase
MSSNSHKLSVVSQSRLKRNAALRILDSKEPEDQEIVKQAPLIQDFMTDQSKQIFSEIKQELNRLNVSYIEDPYLVRGIEYYNHICFEFLYNNQAILAGGRYDLLATMIDDGPEVPAIGWAAGIDRIADVVETLAPSLTIGIVHIGSEHRAFASKFASKVRDSKRCQVVFNPGLESTKHSLRWVSSFEPKYVIFIGSAEVEKRVFKVKNFRSGEQKEMSWEELEKLE